VATQDLKLAETPRKPEVLPQKIEIGGTRNGGASLCPHRRPYDGDAG